jgi:hypothetical protein
MTTPNWDAWRFLVGEWVGEGGGAPGQGGGSLIFHFDLQQHVLLRKNRVEFPAVPDRAAFAHDDLTVIYPDPAGGMRAIYFDNEGHVIHYTVAISEDWNTITFVSDPTPSAPRFRTTYIKGQNEVVTIRFEIASPGNREEFSLYTEGTATRK